MGINTGFGTTTGSYNTFVGCVDASLTAVGGSNTTGSYNVAMGNGALYSNTTASYNTALGYQAGYSTTANGSSTFVGAQAGLSTTGTVNTFIGQGAGSSVTTGGKNTILGAYSGNQGSLDIRTASNRIVLSDGDGNPRLIADDSGNWVTGSKRSAIQTGQGCLFYGTGQSSGAYITGDAATALYVNRETSDGTVVDIRRSSSTVGSISITTTATAYNTSSDYRLKNTIAPMTGALAKVALLKPCTYKWNADGSGGEGFIAHELAEICPHAVVGGKDEVDANGNPVYQGIDTSFLVATLTAAIQELKAEFDAYKLTHP